MKSSIMIPGVVKVNNWDSLFIKNYPDLVQKKSSVALSFIDVLSDLVTGCLPGDRITIGT